MEQFKPTRDQVEAAARAANVEIEFTSDRVVMIGMRLGVVEGEHAYRNGELWTPWLPGADCMELMAAIECEPLWDQDEQTVFASAWTTDEELITSPEIKYNTPESKAAALAQAVFICAAKVGGWRE